MRFASIAAVRVRRSAMRRARAAVLLCAALLPAVARATPAFVAAGGGEPRATEATFELESAGAVASSPLFTAFLTTKGAIELVRTAAASTSASASATIAGFVEVHLEGLNFGSGPEQLQGARIGGVVIKSIVHTNDTSLSLLTHDSRVIELTDDEIKASISIETNVGWSPPGVLLEFAVRPTVALGRENNIDRARPP